MVMPWSGFSRNWSVLDELRRRMDRMFDEYEGGQQLYRGYGLGPRAGLFDTEEEIVLVAEVPGVRKDDLEVNVHQDVLTLSGKRSATVPEGYSVHRQERGEMDFSRSFTLPCAVDAEKTSAKLDEGVLTVRMAKAPEERPHRIPVSS